MLLVIRICRVTYTILYAHRLIVNADTISYSDVTHLWGELRILTAMIENGNISLTYIPKNKNDSNCTLYNYIKALSIKSFKITPA